VLSAGTDGIDGNSLAAERWRTERHSRARPRRGLRRRIFFKRSDAHSFFARLGDEIVHRPTGKQPAGFEDFALGLGARAG